MPGWQSLSAVLAAKQGRGELRLDSVAGALRLLAGTGSGLVAVAFWLAAARGLVRLARRDRELALFGGFLAAVQAAALWVLGPYGLGNPVVLARYLLVALPVVLLWAAHGVAMPRRGWTAVSAALLLGSVLATGPFVIAPLSDLVVRPPRRLPRLPPAAAEPPGGARAGVLPAARRVGGPGAP